MRKQIYLSLVTVLLIPFSIFSQSNAVIPIQVRGSGSSFVNPVMQNWVGNFSTVSNGPVQISYDSVGSRSGKANLIAGTTQFAGSDAPLTASDYSDWKYCHDL